MSRLLCVDAFAVALPDELPAGERLVSGSPTASLLELPVTGLGLWEMTAGVAIDTETEEVFIVLGGRATVAFGDGEVLELAAGSVVHLRAGDLTTWTVREPLRKLYVQLG